MKPKNANEVKAILWEKLNLVNRAIVFHVLDVDDGKLYFRPDLIDSEDGLYDNDAFFDIATAMYDEETIHVTSVESYMIGDGEADHADYEDCEVLEDIAEEALNAMEAFLRNEADLLVALSDFTLENPAYEGDDGEDDADE